MNDLEEVVWHILATPQDPEPDTHFKQQQKKPGQPHAAQPKFPQTLPNFPRNVVCSTPEFNTKCQQGWKSRSDSTASAQHLSHS